jgi:hypothetical protein
MRRRTSSMPPRRSSAASRTLSSAPAAASTAVAGQHPGLAPPVPVTLARAAEVPEWHVSINDVPVGPIRLEEMAHKIDASAVSEYTLVWRDGFDEWRPLATVPELMALLHERRHSGPPARSSFSSMPPFVDSRTSIAESDMPAAVPSPVSPPPTPADAGSKSAPLDFAPLADALQPETGLPDSTGQMSQPPAPLGPDGVFQSSPQLGSFSGLPPGPNEAVAVPSVPPPAAAATAEPDDRLSLGVLALIIAVVVFSGVVAFLAFDRFGDSLLEGLLGKTEPVAAAPIAPVPVPTPAEEPEVVAEPVVAEQSVLDGEQSLEGEGAEGELLVSEAVDGEAGETAQVDAADAAPVVEPPNPKDEGPKMAPAAPRKPRARRAPRPRPAAAPATKDNLSAADQKLLADFDSSAEAAPAKIDVEKSGSTQSKHPPLDGDGVRATVTTNKPRLQRCYERAIRGQQSPPSVRLDVTVTVAASGRVKAVNAAGSGPGGLAACVEASVRRWRFPASSEGGPAKFPIVFSAN